MTLLLIRAGRTNLEKIQGLLEETRPHNCRIDGL